MRKTTAVADPARVQSSLNPGGISYGSHDTDSPLADNQIEVKRFLQTPSLRMNLHRPKQSCVFVCAILFILTIPLADADDNWPRFRGAAADGVAADDPRLPDRWSHDENIAWSVDVPGLGWSNPIVWGNRVFVTTVVSDEANTQPKKGLYLGKGVREPEKGIHHWMVHCFDLTSGRELWKHEARSGVPEIPRHPKSSYAAETPTTDGERVYVLFGDIGLFCYSMKGDLVWSKPIEAKKTFFDYGAAASPVVHDGQVIVVYDNLEASWIAALDVHTGNENWRQSRDERRSWATPLIWENKVRTEIVVPGRKRNRSYSLDGKSTLGV